MDVLGQDRREGLGRKAESRVGLLLAMLVSIVLLLSSLYSAEASVFKKARETVIDAAAPALTLLAGPISYIQGVVGNISDYFNVLEQNQALREENAELRQWMNEALALRETLATYERLQSYLKPPEVSPIDAFVVGESNDAFAHSMIVNAGAKDGVERGQAVVDDRGLVGRIVNSGNTASRILLLTDVQSRIPVYIEGAEQEGILVGKTSTKPAISFIESSDPVTFAPGQRVLTSGAGGVLPRGIPVGTIVEEKEGEAVVDLYANYARTRMVRVINYEFPQVEPAPAEAVEPAPRGEQGESTESQPAAAPAREPSPAQTTAAEPALEEESAEPLQTDDEPVFEPEIAPILEEPAAGPDAAPQEPADAPALPDAAPPAAETPAEPVDG
jgi:rod shape-determining protein MreC